LFGLGTGASSLADDLRRENHEENGEDAFGHRRSSENISSDEEEDRRAGERPRLAAAAFSRIFCAKEGVKEVDSISLRRNAMGRESSDGDSLPNPASVVKRRQLRSRRSVAVT
jgi:hypothetical protein